MPRITETRSRVRACLLANRKELSPSCECHRVNPHQGNLLCNRFGLTSWNCSRVTALSQVTLYRLRLPPTAADVLNSPAYNNRITSTILTHRKPLTFKLLQSQHNNDTQRRRNHAHGSSPPSRKHATPNHHLPGRSTHGDENSK